MNGCKNFFRTLYMFINSLLKFSFNFCLVVKNVFFNEFVISGFIVASADSEEIPTVFTKELVVSKVSNESTNRSNRNISNSCWHDIQRGDGNR